MKTILLIALIVGIPAAIANMIWVILGARADKLKGDNLATIDRNLKAAEINLGIVAVFMLLVVISTMLR